MSDINKPGLCSVRFTPEIVGSKLKENIPREASDHAIASVLKIIVKTSSNTNILTIGSDASDNIGSAAA